MPKSKADKLYASDKRIPLRSARTGFTTDPMGPEADKLEWDYAEDEVSGRTTNHDLGTPGPDRRKEADEARKKVAKKAKSERMYKDSK